MPESFQRSLIADVKYIVEEMEKYRAVAKREEQYNRMLHLFGPTRFSEPKDYVGRAVIAVLRYQETQDFLRSLDAAERSHCIQMMQCRVAADQIASMRSLSRREIRWMRLYAVGVFLGLDFRTEAEYRLSRVLASGFLVSKPVDC